MNTKGIFLFVFSIIVLTSFLFTVSAAQNVITNTTLNNSNISGTHLIYASITGVGVESLLGNVSFRWQYYNGTIVNISIVNNDSATNDTLFSYSWDTTTIADSKNGTLNLTAYTYVAGGINATNATTGIDLDNTAPVLAVYSGATLTAYANTSIKTNTTLTGSIFPNNLTLNISVSDSTLLAAGNWTVAFCTVNVNNGLNHSVPLNMTSSLGWCNSSDINITGLTEGNKTIRIWVNDSVNTVANSSLVVHIDTTAPVPAASCSPTTVQTGDTHPCSCSASDATSGVASSSAISTSGSTTLTTSTGTFTYTCSATDNGGLTAESTAQYTVVQSTGSSGGGGGGGGSSTGGPRPQVYSFTKVTPGVVSIAKYVDQDIGVKEIQIEVNNPAQTVKVTVTKYDGKPASVTVAKEGKVYQYMQINVTNVQDKLTKAKIKAKVKKSWVTSNGVDKDKIILSKFDESDGQWKELDTTYALEDGMYYYYEAEVSSFSYFSLSEQAAAEDTTDQQETTTPPDTTGTTSQGRNLTWLWIVIAVIVVAVLWFGMKKKR